MLCIETLSIGCLRRFGMSPLSLNECLTLEPGYVLVMGTPAGVGQTLMPPVWLKPGDRFDVEIEKIGMLSNGETIGALTVTDMSVFCDGNDPLLMRAYVVSSPDQRLHEPGKSAADVATRASTDLRALLEVHSEHIAAVIIEPLVQCAAGMAMHDPGYLRAVRSLCDEYDVHLIADEIAVGCARTGSLFGFEQAAVDGGAAIWPDFICLSKGFSRGYLLLSLVMTRDRIYTAFLDDDVARAFLHSHSHMGSPLARRAALAVLDRFEQEDMLNQNRKQARALTTALAPLSVDHRIEHFRQLGMIWAFNIWEEMARPRFAERFHMEGRTRELLSRPIGRTIHLLPLYVLNEGLSHWLADRVSATLNTVYQRADCHADRTSEPATA